MKYLKYFLFLLLIIPFMVLAEECDKSKITITSMEQNNINGNTEELSTPTYKDRNIKLNLKMYDFGDSITYDMTIKNDSKEDYMIDEDTFETDSDYIIYTLKTNDNSNVVKANSSKNMTLIVTYKKEVEADKLTNNKFNASNSLKLSLNTSFKEEPLSVITTDNIKEVKNPITSVSSILLIIIALLITTTIAYILITRKSTYTKYLLIVFSMLLVPTVYAICTCDIEVESTIEIEKKPKLFDTIANIAKEDNSCVSKYGGEVTDEVGKTVTATNVYFDKCAEQRNVIFGGFCWQVVRTTETSGTKLIYNGEPVDGRCDSSEEYYGVREKESTRVELNSNYLYSSYYKYDSESRTFTLEEPGSLQISDEVIGKYTCLSESNTCEYLYNINSYIGDNDYYATKYEITLVDHAFIGRSSFNSNSSSPAMVGYMFNKVYDFSSRNPGGEVYKFGNSFTYDTNTNTYTLSGEIKTVSKWSNDYDSIDNNHYTCWNTTGECNKISYVYYTNYNSVSYFYLTNGKSIEDILDEMLYAEDVNKNSSTLKAFLENWYKNNLGEYDDFIEDTVFCNDRTISGLGGFNPNGGITYSLSNLTFNSYYSSENLVCNSIIDQFSVSNNKAKITYPIALLSDNEFFNLDDSLRISNNDYWNFSPSSFSSSYGASNKTIYGPGWLQDHLVSAKNGVRPSISLKNDTKVYGGTGSETDPWIIK